MYIQYIILYVYIYIWVLHVQVIHELKLLPFVVKDVEQKVKSFRFYSDEVSLSDSNGWWNQRISKSVVWLDVLWSFMIRAVKLAVQFVPLIYNVTLVY